MTTETPGPASRALDGSGAGVLAGTASPAPSSDSAPAEATPSETAPSAPHPFVPWVLISCTAIAILSTGLYAPSLPRLPALLGSDAATVQLTMSLNLAAYAGAQLFHGPLADRFGRRRLLILGSLGFILASLACALAPGIGWLLTGRIAQGLAGSVAAVVVLIMIRELYREDQALRILGLFGAAVGLAPAVGPLIGGYLTVYAGWRSNFALLALLATLVLLAILRWLPESGRRDPGALRPRRVLGNYRGILASPSCLRFLLPLSLLFGGLFAFVIDGPFVLIDRLGVATQHYGLCSGAVTLSYVAGSLAVMRLAGRLDPDRIVGFGLLFAASGALVLLLPLLLGLESLAGILLGMAVFAFGLGLVLAGGPVGLLTAAGDDARGSASALCGAMQVGAASLAGLLVGGFHDGGPLPLAWSVTGFALLAAFGYLAAGRAVPAMNRRR